MAANGGNFFDSLKKFQARIKTVEKAEGRVVSIEGPTAFMRVGGSSQIQEAWYGKGMSISAGDKCVLQRTGRDPRWVIVGSFSTVDQGHSETTPPPPADTPTSDPPANTPQSKGWFTNNLGGITFPSGSASTQTLATLTINTNGGIVQVGFSGYYAPNQSTARIDVYLNGSFATRQDLGNFYHGTINFTHADLALPAGTHTYTITAYASPGIAYISSFWITELP